MRATKHLGIVHSYVCGLTKTTSMGGVRYFMIFIDESSKLMLYALKSKGECFEMFEDFKTVLGT